MDNSGGAAKTYDIKVQVDGPNLTQSTADQVCFDPPQLVLFNTQGKVDSIYAPGATINTLGGTVQDSQGNPVQVLPSTQKIVNRFGYVHP